MEYIFLFTTAGKKRGFSRSRTHERKNSFYITLDLSFWSNMEFFLFFLPVKRKDKRRKSALFTLYSVQCTVYECLKNCVQSIPVKL